MEADWRRRSDASFRVRWFAFNTLFSLAKNKERRYSSIMRSLFFLFLITSAVGYSLGVSAAPGQGITVEPVFEEISFGGNQETERFEITLKNDTVQPVVLRPSIVDFGSLDESGGVAFLGAADQLERKYGLASWMQPEKDAVFLEPGEVEKLPLVIENRESLSPGGHYAAVVFQVGSGDEMVNKENEVAVNQLLSVLVFVKKKGGEVYNLELKDVEWWQGIFLVPSEVRSRFQNAGNVHVTPRGVMTLTDPFGRDIAKGILNEESGIILPETQRTYVTKLEVLKRAFLPGTYTLAVSYRYDGEENFRTVHYQFFLFPWQGIVFFLLGMCFLFWWIQKYRKKQK